MSTVNELGPRLDPFQNLSAHYLLVRLVDAAVTIRPATEADEAVLRELWEEFEQEVTFELEDPETWADEWKDTLDDIRDGRRLPCRGR